jgi:hypothetical protein
VGGLLSAFV